MNVAFPWVLWGTVVAVAGVIAAHLLSVTQPHALRLPTVRFIPVRTIRAVSRASAPRDVMLLLVRVTILTCIGGALAGITWSAARVPVHTVIAVESGALLFGDATALRDALQRAISEYAPVRAIILGDTLVTIADPSRASLTVDSLMRTPRVPAPGTLAATLLRARRAAPLLVEGADSMRLLLISTERVDVTTAALDAIRATWPGSIVRLPIPLQVAMADSVSSRFSVTVRATRDDIVAAAFAQWPELAARQVLVIRDSMTRADSAAAAAGAVIVVWLRRGVPPGWSTIVDSADSRERALIGGGRVVVAPFMRIARAAENATALVWWPDGSAAATEEPLERGCIRWVGIGTPAGDALLSVDARAVLSTLTTECGATFKLATSAALDSAQLRRLAGGDALAVAAALRVSQPNSRSPFTRWLLLAALLLLVVESVLRARHVRERGVLSARSRRDTDDVAAYPEAVA